MKKFSDHEDAMSDEKSLEKFGCGNQTSVFDVKDQLKADKRSLDEEDEYQVPLKLSRLEVSEFLFIGT